MEISKRQSYGDGGDDIISMLPDEFLTHIMSFMQTEEAIKLSSVSKRWRYLWRYVPVIDIVDRTISNGLTKLPFMKFVDIVLSLNEVPRLEKFTVAWEHKYSRDVAGKWLDAAFKREIVSLNLEFWYGLEDFDPVELDLNAFTHTKKLVNLNLRYNVFPCITPGPCFPSLKTLVFHYVDTLSCMDLKMILEACPILEELEIDRDDGKDCMYDNMFVKSSTLKKLRVHTRERVDASTVSLKIDAINLQEIDLNIALPPKFESSDLPSLVTANIKIGETRLDTTCDIIRKISNTKRLVFNMNMLCDFGCDDLPTFRNLTNLVMEINDYTWPILPYLLEGSPNLISLTLAQVSGSEEKCDRQCRKPKCSMSCLTKIVLYGFQYRIYDMEIIKYLIKNSPVLEKMSFISSSSVPKGKDELLLLFKRWHDCEIEFF